MKEKKDRVDDALCATRAATEEGVVIGGGTTYIRAQQEKGGEKFLISIFLLPLYYGSKIPIGQYERSKYIFLKDSD